MKRDTVKRETYAEIYERLAKLLATPANRDLLRRLEAEARKAPSFNHDCANDPRALATDAENKRLRAFIAKGVKREAERLVEHGSCAMWWLENGRSALKPRARSKKPEESP